MELNDLQFTKTGLTLIISRLFPQTPRPKISTARLKPRPQEPSEPFSLTKYVALSATSHVFDCWVGLL